MSYLVVAAVFFALGRYAPQVWTGVKWVINWLNQKSDVPKV